MKGWEVKALADVCQIRPPKAEARRKLSPNDLVSFVPMNDLGDDAKTFEPRETKALADVEGSYTYFADDDVLLAKITPCFENGKLGIARNLKNGIGFGSSEFVVLRPNEGLCAEYLYHFLSRSSFREDGAKRMTGAVGHKRIPKEFVEQLQIPLPPLDEQRRIVAILDEAFAGLAVMRQHAEANLKNARAVFDSHLNAIFSQRGDGWVETTLGEVADFKNGLNYTQTSKGEVIRIVGVKDFQNHFWMPIDGLDEVQIDGALPPSYELQDDDILTVRSNGNKQLIGRCILARGISGKASHSGFTIRIRVTDRRMNPVFLTRYLKSDLIRRTLIESGDGANISSLNQKALTALPVNFPDQSAQQRIVAELEEVEANAAKLETLFRQKLAAIDELKQSILHRAFSGQLTREAIAA